MPAPGAVGSVWALDTWGAATWADDTWAGAETPPVPTPPASGGGYHFDEKEVDAIERLLYQKGRVRAIQRKAVAHGSGSVVNPVKPKRVKKPVPVAEPEPVPIPAVSGVLMALCEPTCEAVGMVGLGTRDEAIAVAAALNDPLADWLRRELDL